MRLEGIKKILQVQQEHNYEACVELARSMFQDIFYNQIAQLLHSFPLDHKTENGKLFWSGLKRAPEPIAFNSSDPLHIEFIQATANIFAHIFNLKPETNLALIAKIADNVKVPEFQPRKVAIKTEEGGQAAPEPVKEEEDEEAVERLEKELRTLQLNRSGKWNLIEFEKDDPTNYHIEQVGSVSNLRARNYKIEEVDNFKVKLIAGKIIPAIATTTAMVVGAVGIEITKKILKHKNELFKNSFMNLALPLWVFSDPLPPIENEDKAYDEILLGPVKAIPPSTNLTYLEFTIWDKIEVKDLLEEKGYSLHGKGRMMGEIGFFGLGGSSPTPIKTATTYTEEEIALVLQAGYEQVKDASQVVLISHVPPRGVRDRSFIGLRGGSRSVKAFLEMHPVSLCLCGHIHEASGIERFQNTIVANSGSFKKGRYVSVEIGPNLAARPGRI